MTIDSVGTDSPTGFGAGLQVIAAANRDPAVYGEPDRLDITWTNPPALLSFGGGIHHCLGAHLYRLELAEALSVITRRMPNPHRAGPAPWKPLVGITGPTTQPIAFDAGHWTWLQTRDKGVG